MGDLSGRDARKGGEDWLMFAPAGFTPMSEVEKQFGRAAAAVLPLPKQSEKLSAADRRAFDFALIDVLDAKRRAFSNFLSTREKIFVCSPAGVPLRVSREVLSYSDDQALDRTLRTGFSGFWVIDSKTWLIECKRLQAWISEADEKINNLRQTYKIQRKNGLSIERASLHLDFLSSKSRFVGRLFDAFSQLEGFSLCLEDRHAPNPGEDLSHYFGQPEPEEDEYRVGRPSKQDAALDAYNTLYPRGHGSHSWKAVLRSIESHNGVSIGLDTLKRALGLRAGSAKSAAKSAQKPL